MPVECILLKSTYFDSVYLMALGARLGKEPGVRRTAVLMATPANQEALREFGVAADALAGAGAVDLAVAVDGNTSAQAQAALALVDGWLLETLDERGDERVATLDTALQVLPETNLALISVPGEYAAYEARRALDRGLHVFLFSDNVSIEDELALKRRACELGLLVMGPDCGTAIIAGAGIGFANVVRRGRIGLVGPSGTGIQQVSCLIDAAGEGVSHAIGTGSRDLSDAIGGLTTLQALDALADDDETAVIVLVSKPAGPHPRARVLDWIARAHKPVVTCFLGPEETPAAGFRHVPRRTLAGAAVAAVALARHEPEEHYPLTVADMHATPPLTGPLAGYVRGLFAGGTFCYEAQQILLDLGIEVQSNAPLRRDLALADALRGAGHCLIDLGDDLFTRGRPHPMIDATLRNERIMAEARRPGVGVLLLDFVLGYGAAADPVGDTLPAIEEARRVAAEDGRELQIVAFVCGTAADPQNRVGQEAALAAAGVIVAPSSSTAARTAAWLRRPASARA
jgi:succinyl-CoA synthetase alpha subunit